MLDYLVGLATRLGQWGYLIISLGAMLESAAFLGLIVPGESLVVIAGFLSGQGVFDLDVLIIVVVIGAILGDNLGYELGRRLGRPWAARYGWRVGVSEARLRHAEEFFSRHGGKAVFLGRFVGFARALVPFIAGSARMSYAAFLSYNALGAALWGATFTLLGYFLGQAAEKWVGKATALLGAMVLLALMLAWLWRQLAGHERQIKERWQRLKRMPAVAALLTGFAPQLAWLRGRLSPGSYFGLELTAGVLLFLGAAWLFGGIAQDVVAGDPLTIFDRKIEVWFHLHQDPAMTALMSAVSWLHTWPVALGMIVFLLYLAWQRSWRWLVIAPCAVAGGTLLNSLLKLAFHRERPSLSGLAATLTTYSFPSGHTVAATLIYSVIATYLASRVVVWKWRVFIVLVAVFLVAVVALSRMYLGVHYFSDVLAAAAEGLAWFALCHIAVTTLWTHQSHRRLGRESCQMEWMGLRARRSSQTASQIHHLRAMQIQANSHSTAGGQAASIDAETLDRRQKAALEREIKRSRRAVLVVNTMSRRGARAYSQAKRQLADAGVMLDAAYPVRHADRVPEVVRAAIAQGHTFIIVGGGDGTISSVVDYFAYTNVVFGLLPLGTANSFARTLGIPLDLAGAIDVLIKGKVADIDLGKINDDYFANGAALGLPAAVGRATPHSLKRWLGRAGYLLVAANKFVKHKPFRCTVTVAGQTASFEALDVRIASGSYQGGVLVAREANVDDGAMVVQILKGASKWALAREWARVAFGAPFEPGDIEVLKAREMIVETIPTQHVAIDGEVVTETPIRVSVAREALLLMVPRSFEDRDDDRRS